uniref:Venom peptide Pcr9.4 n=1 Tax=Turris cryptorrhaphe TaxID=940235 RepID=A0A976LXR0_9CAEN|nr:venom peptide precursor Pcr9.4 [Turris cryptorrhaphe]
MRFGVLLLIVALLLAYLMSINARDQAEEKRSTMKKGGHAIMIMPRDLCDEYLENCTSPYCQEQSNIQNGDGACNEACNYWDKNCRTPDEEQ